VGGIDTAVRRLLIGIVLAVSPTQAVSFRSDWMGAYFNRTKVGYSFLADGNPMSFPTEYLEGFDLVPGREGGATRALYSESNLEIQASGAKNHVGWRSLTILEGDFSLAAFGFLLSSGGTTTRIEGERVGSTVTLIIGDGDTRRKQTLAVPEGRLFVAEALPLTLSERLRQGQPVDGEYSVLEPHQLTVSTWRAHYEGRETLQTPTGPVECHRIKQDAGGFFPIIWIDDKGTVWKEYAPLGDEVGYFSYRETEAEARDKEYVNPLVLEDAREDPDGKEPDLLYSTAIDAGTRIARPSQVRRMVVDLWDFELPEF